MDTLDYAPLVLYVPAIGIMPLLEMGVTLDLWKTLL